MSKAVVRQAALVSILEKVAMDDAEVVQAANKCFEATRAELEAMVKMTPFELDLQLQARGWSRRDFEIAVEARKPRSECSYAVQMAHERTGMRIRQAVERGGTTVNVAMILPSPVVVPDEELDDAQVIDVGDT